MNRRKFLGVGGGTVLIAGVTFYLLSDRHNFSRAAMQQNPIEPIALRPDEREILQLASLAPSGHNTQPWIVKYIEPYHWIISNDKSKWLRAVDPTQRETILSIGAFLQNLEYAANSLGYNCQVTVLAINNQDENIAEVKLNRLGKTPPYNIENIEKRRTVRSNYLNDILKKEDLAYLMNGETGYLRYIPNSSIENNWLNEQTIEANRIQSYRDDAQSELSNWIRFSSKTAKKYCDGLTTASMEIKGVPAWLLRNFYGKSDVMKKGFRETGIDTVQKQVAQSAGWLLISSKDNSSATLLETGRRMQRIFLKVRSKNIALHPMTQILEESSIHQTLQKAIGLSDHVQFIIRTGYLKDYPEPVSLRRPVEQFLRI